MKATWILPNGQTITADVPEGKNLMEAAVAASVPHVIGECGGSLSCATCHVYVSPEWATKTGTPETSRLSCQIKMTAALDGITLIVPG